MFLENNMNKKVSFGKLLDENGELIEAGYQTSLVKEYNRSDIKAKKSRIKEWDYYYIGDSKRGVAFTIDDNSYMALDSISLLDFRKPWEHTNSPMKFFTMGKRNFPSTSEKGDIEVNEKGYFLSFKNNGRERILSFHMDNFLDNKPIDGNITLICNPSDSMVIVTPFKDVPDHFYYNQKINCMPAKGKVSFDGKDYIFDENSSCGVLDWGRGVWTYKNTWYWGSASGRVDGHLFGFNIGYGFGDTSAESENMLFYDNKAHKLSEVKFNIPQKDGKDDFMSPWTLSSLSGDINVIFKPILDRHSDSNVLLIRSNQHQVFGLFTGNIKIHGEEIHFENVIGFAEKVYNRW